jgi:hypothetical protein
MNTSIRRTIPAALAIATAGLASAAAPIAATAQDAKFFGFPRVIVHNSHDRPVPVYDVHQSDPGEQFFLNVTAPLNSGAASIGTVPADRRYVVQHVSAQCSTIPATPLFGAKISLLTAAGARSEHTLVVSPMVSFGISPGVSSMGTPMTLEAGPGALLSFTGSTFNPATVGGSCAVAVSGRSYPAS